MSSEIRYRSPLDEVGHAQLHHVITLDPELSDGAKVTYALYLMYSRQGAKCWPARMTVAERRGVDAGTISRHNRELEAAGYITRDRRYGKTSITWIEDIHSNPRLRQMAEELLVERRTDAPSNVAKMQRSTSQKCAAEEESRKKNQKNNPPPIGGDDASLVVVEHDLEEVAFLMEGTGQKKDNFQAACPECGATHLQDMNACPDCGAHVVWHNSRVWRREYGKPANYARRLRYDLKAETPLQLEACRAFYKSNEFGNITQKRTFKTLEGKYADAYIQGRIAWATGKGFQAFVGAVKNKDNYDRWFRENVYEPTKQSEAVDDGYPPSGWMLTALKSAEEERANGPIYGEG